MARESAGAIATGAQAASFPCASVGLAPASQLACKGVPPAAADPHVLHPPAPWHTHAAVHRPREQQPLGHCVPSVHASAHAHVSPPQLATSATCDEVHETGGGAASLMPHALETPHMPAQQNG